MIKKECLVPNCKKPRHRYEKYCTTHVGRMYKTGKWSSDDYHTKPLYQRIMRKRKITENGCWEYTGKIAFDGYGVAMEDNKLYRIHRYVYIYRYGEIGDNLVLHLCDNRKCFNPKHLIYGDAKKNMEHAKKRKRLRVCDKSQSAKLTMEQFKYILGSTKRNCDLARELGVHYNTIYRIRYKKTWRSYFETKR